MFSHFLFPKLKCYMLSHMNEVDPFIFCCMFLYEIQNCIFHAFNQHMPHKNGDGLELPFLYDE